jgi:hypothetical protein
MYENRKPELTLLPYLALARDLSTLLTPVQPNEHFHAELYGRLVESARQQQAERSLLSPATDEASTGIPHRVARWAMSVPGQDRRWVLGAAAVGSAVSVAGIAAYVLRHRGRRAA